MYGFSDKKKEEKKLQYWENCNTTGNLSHTLSTFHFFSLAFFNVTLSVKKIKKA